MPSYFWMTNESGIYLEAFGKSARDLTEPERLVLQEPNRNEHLSHLIILTKLDRDAYNNLRVKSIYITRYRSVMFIG